MGILQAIKNYFNLKQAEPANLTVYDFEEYEAKHLSDVAAESSRFEEKYGDFTAFLYRRDFDQFLRKEVLFFREPEGKFNDFLDNNYWQEKHHFNFPGPFYTGQSDTCGTGCCEAPRNVMNDENCCEYVFKQPKNFQELLCVIDAAAVEVFDSYSSNGNDYWTYSECKNWWANRAALLIDLKNEEAIKMNHGNAQFYVDYLNGDAEMDLRRYCYFLIHGRYPTDDSALPEL